MNEIITTSSTVELPKPRCGDIHIRVATMADLPFLDAMQKQFGKALGYFPTKQFEGYIEMGGVLVARASSPWSSEEESEDTGRMPVPQPQPLGYVISRDRYLKRDELGVIYQLCVAPGDQRKLIGASLVREVFERSAYGCRLYCCWCAQDLDANYFWESLGFVPIAFRAGSTGKKRVHIFWQRRIVEGDATPWWYPFKTDQGAIREDRLVFPIPPGTHWKEVQAVALPRAKESEPGMLPEPTCAAVRKRSGERSRAAGGDPKARNVPKPATVPPLGGLRFQADQPVKQAKPKRQRIEKPKVKLDPKYLAAARELRDRWMERANDRLLIAPGGKYQVSRTRIAEVAAKPIRLLKAG